MIFEKDGSKGVFPGISVQLFNFDTPVAKVAMVACHCLPASWNAFLLPNEDGDKVMVFQLEDSPFRGMDDNLEDDSDAEEYRPLDGNVWVYHGDSSQMRALVNTAPNTFINCLVYHKLDQDKKFSASILELREQGKY